MSRVIADGLSQRGKSESGLGGTGAEDFRTNQDNDSRYDINYAEGTTNADFYQEESLLLDGDFSQNAEVYVVKNGNAVTITSLSAPGHTSTTTASTASGWLPLWARPKNLSVSSVYRSMIAGGDLQMGVVSVEPNGALILRYFIVYGDGTGVTAQTRVDAGASFTVSYVA